MTRWAIAVACGLVVLGPHTALAAQVTGGAATNAAATTAAATTTGVRVERLLDGPIITPDLHPSIGENIQGPSLIRVPEWVQNPLGAYYLYCSIVTTTA